MTKREGAIIGAYTGILCGDFSDMHDYISEIMKRPIFAHELASGSLVEQIKQKAKPDFLKLCKDQTV